MSNTYFIWQYYFPLISGGQLFILFLRIALAKANYIYAAFAICFTEIITYFSEQKIVVVYLADWKEGNIYFLLIFS